MMVTNNQPFRPPPFPNNNNILTINEEITRHGHRQENRPLNILDDSIIAYFVFFRFKTCVQKPESGND